MPVQEKPKPRRIAIAGLDNKSLLYALRCVHAAKARTPENVGIGKMTLDRLVRLRIVSDEGAYYALTETGRRLMQELGGPFPRG